MRKVRVIHIARTHLVFDVVAQHTVCSFRQCTRQSVLHHQGSARHFRMKQEVGVTAQARPLGGVTLAEWRTQPANTGYEPSSPASPITSLTASTNSCATTTPP